MPKAETAQVYLDTLPYRPPLEDAILSFGMRLPAVYEGQDATQVAPGQAKLGSSQAEIGPMTGTQRLRAAAVSQPPSEMGGENPLQSPTSSTASIGRDCGDHPFAAVCDALSGRISSSGDKS
jgi:hypothetical protein